MEPLLLLQGVRHVSEIALPLDPKRVSQRAFDKARPGSDFPDLPAARHIVRSLGMGWADVLALAQEPESAQAHRLSHQQLDTLKGYLTTEYVVYVLGRVARRLGTRTLSRSDYSAERDAMLRHDRARWLHGRQLILPSEDQVVTFMGSWEKALVSAGLAAPPTERGGSAKARAPTIPDLLERFYSHYGVQATAKDLETFARANGIPRRGYGDISFSQALAEWKEWRAAQGLLVPSAPPPPSERADYTRDVGAARSGEKRLKLEHPLEACVDWMCRYLEELPASTHSKQRSYGDWARQHGAPTRQLLASKHGGFYRVRRLAQNRMRAERQSQHSRAAQ